MSQLYIILIHSIKIMNRLLVTGGSGFIGQNLLPIIDTGKYEVHCISSKKRTEASDIVWHHCNLMEQRELAKLFQEVQPSHLIHLAWSTEPGQYNLPDNFKWMEAGMNLLKLFQEYGGKRVLLAGSGVEYDWSYGQCSEETTPVSNETLYGACKNLLREYSHAFLKHHKISYAWCRLFFIYGPSENPLRLVPHVITSLLNGETATVRSGDLYRDYLYVKDYADSLLHVMESDFQGVVNIGSGEPNKIEYIANLIGEIIGRNELIKFERPARITNRTVVADTSILNNQIGWKPKMSVKESLVETIEWWKKNL